MGIKATYYSLTVAVHISREEVNYLLATGSVTFPLYAEGELILEEAGRVTFTPEALDAIGRLHDAEARALSQAKLERILGKGDDGED